jgi:hypothetical protein
VVSDSGSETGAASRAHVWPDAVSLTVHSTPTSAYSPHQVRYSNVRAVRDEEAAGSNPATPTGKRQVTRHIVACRLHYALLGVRFGSPLGANTGNGGPLGPRLAPFPMPRST